jgi:hypothetical protein
MFGGLSIDFGNHGHRRHFYRWLGELLVLVDESLLAALVARTASWLPIPNEAVLITPFEEDTLGLGAA